MDNIIPKTVWIVNDKTEIKVGDLIEMETKDSIVKGKITTLSGRTMEVNTEYFFVDDIENIHKV